MTWTQDAQTVATETTGRAPEPSIGTINIKISPFWSADPLLLHSPQSSLDVRRDLILSTPISTPFDTLKQQLFEWTATSEQRRLQKLFHAEELGNRKPSQLFHRMQQLMGDTSISADNTFLCELFLQCLTANGKNRKEPSWPGREGWQDHGGSCTSNHHCHYYLRFVKGCPNLLWDCWARQT